MEENVLSLFGEDSELTASELNILSMRLWELLSHKTKLYAIDSSSVRAETAQEPALLHLFPAAPVSKRERSARAVFAESRKFGTCL